MLDLPKSIYQEENTFWPLWLKWCPSSTYLAILAETRLLNRVNSVKEIISVPVLNKKHSVRTLYIYKKHFTSEEERKRYFSNIPIVLIHGMGAGLAMWCKNLDSLAEHRQVYAFDLIGFGNSSRPTFSDNHTKAENMFVQSIEDWRIHLELKHFIILGHSLGGYIAYSYGIKHGHVLRHIILADPWGFRECKNRYESPFYMNWTLSILSWVFKFFNPLFPVRLLGPFAPYILRLVRQDLGITFKPPQVSLNITKDNQQLSNVINKGEQIEDDDEEDEDDYDAKSELEKAFEQKSFLLKHTESDLTAIFDYVYHCNTKYPSGEAAFKCLSSPIGWAARPMIKRINDLNSNIDVTFIYGGKSWMDWQTGYQAQHLRLNSSVKVKVIDDAGHHVYAEASNDFNNYVNLICKECENKNFNPLRKLF